MVTVQQIFDQAIHLMDEQNEQNGATVTVDTQEYKSRTISILNTAIPRLYPYSSNYDRNAVGRPAAMILKNDDHANPDFTQNIMLDDDLCIGYKEGVDEPCYDEIFYAKDIYTSLCDCIEWLIKEGYFNKEYLV